MDGADDGADLAHRALARRFEAGRRREREVAAQPRGRIAATRKGRSFPLTKRIAIWRAILAVRPANWRQGDRAAFGAIIEAHRRAAAECLALGIAAPRYRTVYLLWHRGAPGADVLRALGNT